MEHTVCVEGVCGTAACGAGKPRTTVTLADCCAVVVLCCAVLCCDVFAYRRTCPTCCGHWPPWASLQSQPGCSSTCWYVRAQEEQLWLLLLQLHAVPEVMFTCRSSTWCYTHTASTCRAWIMLGMSRSGIVFIVVLTTPLLGFGCVRACRIRTAGSGRSRLPRSTMATSAGHWRSWGTGAGLLWLQQVAGPAGFVLGNSAMVPDSIIMQAELTISCVCAPVWTPMVEGSTREHCSPCVCSVYMAASPCVTWSVCLLLFTVLQPECFWAR